MALLGGPKIFLPFKKKEGGKRPYSYQKANLHSFLAQVPHLFFNYLSQLQALAPTPRCLQRAIPSLKILLERTKYLESQYPMERLMKKAFSNCKNFSKLKGLDQIMARCQKKKIPQKDNL